MTDEPIWGDPDQILDPILRSLYAYWDGKRTSVALPKRSDIDPVEFRKLLPYVLLAECHDGGRRIRFRLVGTDVAFGSDPTGQFLHEAAPEGEYRDHITTLYRHGAISEEGLYSEYEYGYMNEVGPKLIKRLFLPLVGTDDIPRMMLVGQVRDKSDWTENSAWQALPGYIGRRSLIKIRGRRLAEEGQETGLSA